MKGIGLVSNTGFGRYKTNFDAFSFIIPSSHLIQIGKSFDLSKDNNIHMHFPDITGQAIQITDAAVFFIGLIVTTLFYKEYKKQVIDQQHDDMIDELLKD